MKIFDLTSTTAYPHEERDKNIFYLADEFKVRIIELPPGGRMPDCEMASHVIFYVLEGQAEVTVGSEKASLKEKNCLITEPATLSMRTEKGVRLLGIQVTRHLSRT